ncbi:MAG: hypothetical protein KJ065_11785 [Anaerolineae bacterium]|nr:hypothetical protein [Anaerolineae bacterium]
MSELDDFRRKMREKGTGNPEEFFAKVREDLDPNQPSYRLELFFDETTRTVILQGNQAGLENLLKQIEKLARPDTVSGAHAHFDSVTELSENNVDMIIQRVEDNDMGAHQSS